MTTFRADILVDRSFQSCQNPDIFKSWRSCSFQSYQKPRRHYASRQLSELRKQLFGSTRILSAVGIDIPVDRSFHSYQNHDNFKIWSFWSFQSYLIHGQHYTFRQLSELTTKLFGSIKILSAVGVDIRVDRSFNSYQNPDNFKSWRSCSLQRYLTPGRHYASRQRIFQSYLKIETLCFMSTVWVDNRRFRRYPRKLKRVCFPSTV